MTPRVSICLPNFNTRPFLEERLGSILAQTLSDWELVVVDGYSDDGSWELFRQLAAREPRMRISQAPREGIYAGINTCIRQARGENVYIATSDDTMEPRCLERLADALDRHPRCGLAACDLVCIDAGGRPVTPFPPVDRLKAYFGVLYGRPHIRRAPHDGLLHAAGRNVYPSLTQLLARRSLYERVGLFGTEWGYAGDFEWGMRASLVADTVWVPEPLATWRRRAAQATQSRTDASYWAVERDMAIHALRTARRIRADGVLDRISPWRLLAMLEYRLLAQRLVEAEGPARKLTVLAATSLRRPDAAGMLVRARMSGGNWLYPADYEWFRAHWLRFCPAPWYKLSDAAG